jgi:hypothetical protein
MSLSGGSKGRFGPEPRSNVASMGSVVVDLCLVLLTGALGENRDEMGANPGNLIGG